MYIYRTEINRDAYAELYKQYRMRVTARHPDGERLIVEIRIYDKAEVDIIDKIVERYMHKVRR